MKLSIISQDLLDFVSRRLDFMKHKRKSKIDGSDQSVVSSLCSNKHKKNTVYEEDN
jgi:hypothetical protein